MDRPEKWWLSLSLAALGLGVGLATVFWGAPYNYRVYGTS